VAAGTTDADSGGPPSGGRLRALLDLSRRLSASLELDDVLAQFVEQAARLVRADVAAILLWDREANALRTMSRYGVADDPDRPLEPFDLTDMTAVRRVLETQEPVVLRAADAERYPVESRMLAEFGAATALVVPLVTRSETLGVATVIHRSERDWSDDDIDFCQALAAVAATAVQNATLFEQMRKLALRDPLTRLHNRRSFQDQLAGALARGGRTGTRVALAVLDLDGLKAINDRGGHAAGDAAIVAAAGALGASVRVGDVTCRLGGDEFAAVLPGADADAAIAVCERAQRRLDEASPGCTFSAGVAVAEPYALSPDDLFRFADLAAYEAKKAGGGRVERWAPSSD
jgi:diguanylate cyclase (GGDEF)-like protein